MFEQRGWPEGALNHISGLPDPFPDLEIPADAVQGADRDGPLFVASQWPSLGAFFSAELGIAAALRARGITGKGQWVETSLLQGALAGAAGVWQRAEKPDAPGLDETLLRSAESACVAVCSLPVEGVLTSDLSSSVSSARSSSMQHAA